MKFHKPGPAECCVNHSIADGQCRRCDYCRKWIAPKNFLELCPDTKKGEEVEEWIEFANARTNTERRFPVALFNSLCQLVKQTIPVAQRERSEETVQKLVANFLDQEDTAEPLRAAAQALYPEEDGIQFNLIPPEAIQLKLQDWANQLVARYGWPVWLVGSSLTVGRGRDVDVRVVLPDEEFEARFPGRNGLMAEVGKQGRIATLFCLMNVDFQIQKDSEVRDLTHLPRIRLDNCEEPPTSQEGMLP